MTPLESVLSAPLWEVMETISLKVARAKVQHEQHEAQMKQNRLKKK